MQHKPLLGTRNPWPITRGSSILIPLPIKLILFFAASHEIFFTNDSSHLETKCALCNFFFLFAVFLIIPSIKETCELWPVWPQEGLRNSTI